MFMPVCLCRHTFNPCKLLQVDTSMSLCDCGTRDLREMRKEACVVYSFCFKE